MSLQRATDATPSKGHRGKPQVSQNLPIYSYLTFQPTRKMVYVQTIAMSDAALQNMTKSP